MQVNFNCTDNSLGHLIEDLDSELEGLLVFEVDCSRLVIRSDSVLTTVANCSID